MKKIEMVLRNINLGKAEGDDNIEPEMVVDGCGRKEMATHNM